MLDKKVLHVYSSWTAGGAEKTMLSMAAGLEAHGIKNVIACPGDSYMFAKAKEYGLAAYPVVIKGSFDPIGIIRLWNVIRKERIDIVHAHQGKVFWPCIFVKWLSGSRVKVVFHRHAQLPHRFYSRSHYHFSDRIIAISKAVADGLVQREKVDPAKVRVVYNGTDFSRFHEEIPGEEIRKKYDLGNGPVMGTVAAMNRPKGKGQEYLLEAAQIVKDRFPDARYLIVGTGPILDDLKRLAAKLNVEDKVVFTGYQEEVEKYIAAMDIFCFLSWDTEGFGQVMVEAQAMGKPVVGTNIGGIPETFKDSVTGFLIPPKNSEILAQVLFVLLGERRKMQEMGAAARYFVNKHFSLETMVGNVENIYREMYTEEQ